MRHLAMLGAALVPIAAIAQTRMPIQLTVGYPTIDGRIYKAHDATATYAITNKDGSILRSTTYVNHTYITRRSGREVCIVEGHPTAETHDTAFFQSTVLDRRTMALLHLEDRNGTGYWLNADVDGAHVTGKVRQKTGAPIETFDFTLEVPSFYLPFVDAAVGATQIKPGESWRVPTFAFDSARRRTTWHTYRIVRQDTVTDHGNKVPAWVIQNEQESPQTQIWITYEPPYLPLVLTRMPDGSTRRFESSLVKLLD